MANQLEQLSITKADNGGHTVRHEFKRQAAKRSGGMNGGMYMDRPSSEEHSFGPADGHAVMAHVAKALGISAKAEEKAGEE
jgi:hypothetical protein